MNLDDLIKLAGVSKSAEPKQVQVDTPVQEQPMDQNQGMRALIALVTPEQLNQLTGDEAVAEEMPGEATTEPNPAPYKGTLGSPADLSLRRYLGADGMPVKVEETNVYPDHKVEDISEAWQAYKIDEKKAKPDYIDIDGDGDKEESMKKAAKDKKEKADEGSHYGKKKKMVEGMEKDEVMAIMMKYPEDVAKMKQMGDLDAGSELYMALVDYYSDEMPYGTMKARDGDPVEYIMMKLDDLGMMEAKVEEEPNEGNAFTGAMAGKKKGEQFKVGDKTFTKEDEMIAKLKQLAGI